MLCENNPLRHAGDTSGRLAWYLLFPVQRWVSSQDWKETNGPLDITLIGFRKDIRHRPVLSFRFLLRGCHGRKPGDL